MAKLKLIFYALRIAWYFIRRGARSERYQISLMEGTGGRGYIVVDSYLGGSIRPTEYVFRKHEAQAVADALNSVVLPIPNSNQKQNRHAEDKEKRE